MLKTLTIAAVAVTAAIATNAAITSPANALRCHNCNMNGVSLNGISPQVPVMNGAPVQQIELPPAPPAY